MVYNFNSIVIRIICKLYKKTCKLYIAQRTYTLIYTYKWHQYRWYLSFYFQRCIIEVCFVFQACQEGQRKLSTPFHFLFSLNYRAHLSAENREIVSLTFYLPLWKVYLKKKMLENKTKCSNLQSSFHFKPSFHYSTESALKLCL